MKNSLLIILLALGLLVCSSLTSKAENIELQALKINTIEKGNIIKGTGEAEATINENIIIQSDNFSYDKRKKILNANGNVFVLDKKNEIELKSEKIQFLESQEILIAENNVKIYYKKQNIELVTDHINYSLTKDELKTKDVTLIKIKNKYKVKSYDLTFNNKKQNLYSNKKTIIEDYENNKIQLDEFIYSHKKQNVLGKNILVNDFFGNNYSVKQGYLNLDKKELVGKDIEAKLEKNSFGNPKNDPRLKGNAILYGENKTIIKKGIFTTCENNENDCPPWHISSKEIIHDKEKKEIHYKNAWLNIYDQPVLYFPKFFHPDPSVERKSGFLTPEIKNNNNLGSSVTLPYFSVISESSDLTLKPRIFSLNEFLLQNEYRKVTKNSSHILDFSINKNEKDNENGRKTHFFSNSKVKNINSYFNESSLDLKIEKTSNDNYTQEYKLESTSPIINNTGVLESLVKFSGDKDDLQLDFSVESYETMNKSNNDRYEFIYPSYSLSKLITLDNIFFENIDLKSSGNKKNFSTNIFETVQINDFILGSKEYVSNFGITQNFTTLIKNINSEGKNSTKYKENMQSELLNLSRYEISLPLIKKTDQGSNYLIPKMSFMHSPNDTKNIKNSEKILNSTSIFSLERIGHNDNVEGGSSATFGIKYKNKDVDNYKTLETNLATVFRDKEDHNLPNKSTLGKKQSNFIGDTTYTPNENFKISYNYLFENNLNQINLHNITNTFKVNNFVSKFVFYEENNVIGNESYYTSSLGYEFDEKNLITFSTRENKKDNLTEFYDLIYEYKNDCLTASIKYNKKYYTNSYLKPSEDLFFTLTIIPLGSTQSESILD